MRCRSSELKMSRNECRRLATELADVLCERAGLIGSVSLVLSILTAPVSVAQVVLERSAGLCHPCFSIDMRCAVGQHPGLWSGALWSDSAFYVEALYGEDGEAMDPCSVQSLREFHFVCTRSHKLGTIGSLKRCLYLVVDVSTF